MNFVLERVTRPEEETITLLEMKQHLRTYQNQTGEDAEITGLIQMAREWAETFTGRALVDQTWRMTIGEYAWAINNVSTDTVRGANWGSWPYGYRFQDGIPLHKSPVLQIVSVASFDANNVETAMNSANYSLREAASKWPRVVGVDSSYLGGAVRIVYRAGYLDMASSPPIGAVPLIFKQAMMLWAEANYDRDDKMMPLLIKTAEDMLRQERCELGMA